MQQKALTLVSIGLMLIFLSPPLLDTADGIYEHIWLIYLIPVFIMTYIFGLKGGILTSLISTGVHIGFKVREHYLYGQIDNLQSILIIALVDLSLFIIAITLARLTHKANREKELRQNKEEELKEITWNTQDTLDSIVDGLFSLDRNFELVYINKALFKLLPLPSEPLIGKNILEIKELQITEDFISMCKDSLQSQQIKVFHENLNLTGKWSEVRICPSHKGLTIIVRDISDLIAANEALQLTEDIFTIAFSLSPVPLAINKASNGEFLEVNNSFLSLTGFTREEVIGNGPDSLHMLSNAQSWEEFINSLPQGTSIINTELDYLTKNREIRTGLFSFEPITLNHEACLLAVCIDITEMKRMQTEMARLDRLNLIGEMAAGLGHEIRNPLTTVRGFLQFLGKKREFSSAKDQFDLMISELDRSNEIITEFLSLAKKRPTNLALHDINEVIKKIHPLVLADAISKDKEVHLNLGEIPPLLVDEKEIRQLLFNLVRNGLEATNPSGVLTIRTFVDQNKAVLAIQDQGPGISEEVMAKLGTPFFTTKDTGTGLGLAVCYRIAERHNAGIECESGPHGTTFYVKFQLPPQES